MKKEFWIVNTQNKITTLYDLNITLLPYESKNLLNKNLSLSEEQILKSINSGSIKNNSFIKIRKLPPTIEVRHKILLKEVPGAEDLPFQHNNSFKVKEEVFEELQITDEELADEMSDLT